MPWHQYGTICLQVLPTGIVILHTTGTHLIIMCASQHVAHSSSHKCNVECNSICGVGCVASTTELPLIIAAAPLHLQYHPPICETSSACSSSKAASSTVSTMSQIPTTISPDAILYQEEHITDNDGASVTVTTSIFFVIALTAVVLRFIARSKIYHGWRIDDYMIAVALVRMNRRTWSSNTSRLLIFGYEPSFWPRASGAWACYVPKANVLGRLHK